MRFSTFMPIFVKSKTDFSYENAISLLVAFACGIVTAAAQDLIVKRDASRIEAKVSEVAPDAVRYKRWSNPDGPTYVLPVAQIDYIRYANGETERFAACETLPATPVTPATPLLRRPSCRIRICGACRGGRRCRVCRTPVRDRRVLRPQRCPGRDLRPVGGPTARTRHFRSTSSTCIGRVPQTRPLHGGCGRSRGRADEHGACRGLYRGQRRFVGRLPGLRVVPRAGRGVVPPRSESC